MNIKNLIFGTVAVASLAWVGTASAVTVNIEFTSNRNTGTGEPGRNGGEFAALTTENFVGNYASVATYGAGTRFATFCLERNEGISNNGTYNYVVNTAAVAGGIGGGNPDTLSFGTAYLYELFATGLLGGYNYVDHAGERRTHAGLLQEAIWVLENELTGPQGANTFLTMAINQFGGTLAGARADYVPTQSRVRVLNLFARDGTYKQDVLVRVPDAGLTVSLLGLGIMGIAALRRRM
jgi:hypothetical protein